MRDLAFDVRLSESAPARKENHKDRKDNKVPEVFSRRPGTGLVCPGVPVVEDLLPVT